MRRKWKQLQYLRLWIIIVMVIVFSFSPIFAADCTWLADESLQKTYTFLWYLWRLCSWVWIILWNFAWVLMTNIMVYWEFMWLDSFLWKVWQMSRSIANYTLWFFFIYSIFKYIFTKGKTNPISKLKDLLIASVLVQASWFLVMVLVDLSTILLATVSSLPAQIINASAFTSEALTTQVKKNPVLKNNQKVVRINVFTDKYMEENNAKWYTIEESASTASENADKITIDTLLPNANNLWGPFIYLWFTAFNAQDYILREMPEAASCKDKIVKVMINLILESWILVLYSLILAILVVMLIMRLWYLWVIIALSPIIVLLHYTDIVKTKWFDFLNLKKALGLIFQPVIFWLWIGLMFLFVVTIQWVFSRSMWSDLWGDVKVVDAKNSSTSTDIIPKISSSLQDAGVVSLYIKEGAKSLKDIILSLIVLALMWQFIKLAIMWEAWGIEMPSWVKKFWDQMASRIDEAIKMAPVIPVPWLDSRLWLWTVFDWTIANESLKSINKTLKARDKSDKTINELFWFSNAVYVTEFTQQQEKDLKLKTPSTIDSRDFVKKLQEIGNENHWLRLNKNVNNIIFEWIKNHSEWQYATKNTKEYESMQSYFGWSALWDKVRQNTDDEKKLFKLMEDNQVLFKNFYENVLWWNPSADLTYAKFKEQGYTVKYEESESE